MLDKLISIVGGGIRSAVVTSTAPDQNFENTQICIHCGQRFEKPSNRGFELQYTREMVGFICYGCNERINRICVKSKDVGECVDLLIKDANLFFVYYDCIWEYDTAGYEVYYYDDETDYLVLVCEEKIKEWLGKQIFQCKQCGIYFANHLESRDYEGHCCDCVYESAKRTIEFNNDDRCDICGKPLDCMRHNKFGEQGEYSNKVMCTECYFKMRCGNHVHGYSICNKCNLFGEGCIVDERFMGICDKAQYTLDWLINAEEDAQNIDYLLDTAV